MSTALPRSKSETSMRSPRRIRRHSGLRPGFDHLEDRLVPTLTVNFADAIAVSGSGSVDVESNAVYNDASGNVYITGSLEGTANFSPSGTANVTSTGGRDPFLAKYSSTGALIWVQDLRGANSASVAQGSAITVDASGNVIVTGTFTGTFNFDPSIGGNTSFTASARNDAFVAKYNSSGALVWAKQVVGSGNSFDQGYAVAVDASGNIAVGGTFQGTATFGSNSYTAGGSSDSFVAKLGANGNFLWTALTVGSASSLAQTSGLTFDPSGNVILTGFYAGVVDFDPTNTLLQLPNYGTRAIFVQKLGTTGNVVWTKSIGSQDISQGNSVAADSSGNVYVTGTFSSTANFNPSGGTANLTAGGFEDAYILKLTSSGAFGWAKDLGTTGFNAAQGTGIALDASGHVYVAGYYQGTLTLAVGQTIVSVGDFDVFLGEYDTSGNYLASQSYGGANFDAEFGIGVNASGKVALAGRYSGPAAFGSISLPAQSGKSVFVTQVATGPTLPAPPTAPNAPALQAASDSGSSNADRITNVTSPVFNVTGVAAANTAQLLRDGVVVGTRTGPGAITDPGPVTNGNHVYTAIQVDTFNQSSLASPSTTVSFITVAPAAPPAPTLLSTDDSGIVGDGITNINQPTLTGAAQAGATVQILNASNVVIATAAADPTTGVYTVKPSSLLADGVYVLHAIAIDIAGNPSTSSATFSLTIDTKSPAKPVAPTLLQADDSGTTGDGITNVNQPRLTGTAEPGSTVQILNASNVVVAAGIADPTTGVYTLKPSSALADGVYVLHAIAIDVAGNGSQASATFSLTIDTKAPGTPIAPTLLQADDSGTAGDGITNVNQPRLNGNAEPGSTVQILNASNVVIAFGTADPTTGAYSVRAVSVLPDGTYVLHSVATDAAGNVSAASSTFTLTIDTQAPATPAAPTLLPADDSGVAGDGITNVAQPRFIGTTIPNATVQLTSSNVVIGTATSSANGTYTVKPTNPITNLISSIQVQVIDVAGNTSAPSPSFTLYVATTLPPAPSTPALLGSNGTGAGASGVTTSTQPTLIGTTQYGSTVQLIDPNGNVLGKATTSGTAYSVQIASPLAAGSYQIRAQAIDVAGNVGPASSPFSLTVMNPTTLPAAPSTPTLLSADDSGILGDGITNVNKPRLTGTATAGLTVQIVNSGGTVLGSAVVASNGVYTVAFSSPIPDDAIPVRTQIVDANSNVSSPSASFTLTIDTTPPATPGVSTIYSDDDTGAKGDGITANHQPRISGTGVPGTTASLVYSNGATLATMTVPQSGLIVLAPGAPLYDGSYALHFILTDVAGNQSAPSAILNIRVDTHTPAPPTALSLYSADDTGALGDGITNVSQPRLVASTEPGATVTFLSNNGAVIATGTANASGLAIVPTSSSLSDGTYQVTAIATDVAGISSLASPAYSLTILAAAPQSPSVPALNPADDSGVKGDSKTSVRQPRFNGTALPGATVQLVNLNTNTVVGTTIASIANGSYTVQPTTNLPVGNYSFATRIVNIAGTAATSNGTLTLAIIDTTASDFEGDGRSDVGVFRQPTAQWFVAYSSGTGALVNQYGASNLFDIPVNGDFDGIGKSEQAVFRPSTGQWIINGPNGQRVALFGAAGGGDIPVPGDYDGVGYTELAVYRPSTAQWFVLGPNGGHLLGVFGAPGYNDMPAPGDYDGSGHTEMAVFRISTAQWFYQSATGGKLLGVFGAAGGIDIPAPGDYDGVGHTELTVFRPSTGQWFVNGATGGRLLANFGATQLVDLPVETPSGFLKLIGAVKTPGVSSQIILDSVHPQPPTLANRSFSTTNSGKFQSRVRPPRRTEVLEHASERTNALRSKLVVNYHVKHEKQLDRFRTH